MVVGLEQRRAMPATEPSGGADRPTGSGAALDTLNFATLGLSDVESRVFGSEVMPTEVKPFTPPPGFAEAKTMLENLSLLSPVRYTDEEEERFFIHRWTASAVSSRQPADILTEAHRAAAEYWCWRFDHASKSWNDILNLYEARFHYHAAGDIQQAIFVGRYLVIVLDAWGAHQAVERVCRETLSWLDEESPDYPSFWHQLGVTAQKQGLWEEARSHFETALACFQSKRDFIGVGKIFQEFALLESSTGRRREAEVWIRKSFDIWMSLPAEVIREHASGMASCQARLGRLAFERGDFDRAQSGSRRPGRLFLKQGISRTSADAISPSVIWTRIATGMPMPVHTSKGRKDLLRRRNAARSRCRI